MLRREDLWIVVADGTEARFYVPRRDLRAVVTHRPAMHDAHQTKRDAKPGRVFSAAPGGGRHAIEPPHDPRKLRKRKFTELVARALDEACPADGQKAFILVAPRRSLGELRGLLSARVRSRVREEIAKDLTGLRNAELWRHLSPAVLRAVAGMPGGRVESGT